MTSPYRKSEATPLESLRVDGHVVLPPHSHPPAVVRLFFTVALIVLLSATRVFGLARGTSDVFSWVLTVVWWSITLGPALGAFGDAALARAGYRRRSAAVVGEHLTYGVWGLRRTIEPKDLSATRKIDRDVILALRNGAPSIIFRPRKKSGDLPAWMTERKDKGDGRWSFVWRSRSPVFLGGWGTLAWLGAVGVVTALFWGWRGNCLLVFVLLPALVMGCAGIALQAILQYKPHRTGLLTCYQNVWLLHVGSQSKRYVLPVETENGLGTASLRVRMEGDEVLWEPPGGGLSAERQVVLISALAADARARTAPATVAAKPVAQEG